MMKQNLLVFRKKSFADETVGQKNKRVLIYITGKADSTFFYNEIESLVQQFDKVYAITYDDEADIVKRIESKYNINIIAIKMGLNMFLYSPVVIRSLFNRNVRDELYYIGTKYHGKIKILCIAYTLYYMFFAGCVRRQLKEILKKNESCDVYLYSFWMSRAAVSLVMYDYKKYSNVQMIVSRAHGYDLYEERNEANYLPFRRLIAQKLDKILFISDNGKQYFKQYLENRNLQANELDIVHMGVDDSDYIKHYRAKDEMVIVSCSRIDRNKRLDIIICFLQMIRVRVRIRWLHIGDGNLMEETENLAKRKLKDMQFQFLGNVDNNKIIDIYRKVDVDFFINMSDSEGIPVSIMEAFSAGIPAIARNMGGISEIVNDSNGFLIERLDKAYLEDMADKIVECFKDREEYSKLSRNAVEMQRENFNREKNNLKLVNAIMGVSGKT